MFKATTALPRLVPAHVSEFAVKVSVADQCASRPSLMSLHECRVHKLVSGHPNIGTFYNAFSRGPYVLSLTELLHGGDLRSVCEQWTTGLAEETVIDIGAQVASALAHMHARGFAHCDIKPDNVLLAETFSPHGANLIKLVDFGIATEFEVDEQDNASLSVVGGTPGYKPVEVEGGRPVDPRKVDSYCLGVMLCELLTGRHPFMDVGGDEAEAERRWDAASAGMQTVLTWLMDDEPTNRPTPSQTVALLQELKQE